MAFISVADKIYLEGETSGIAKGIAEGEARGEARGEIRGKANSIIAVLKKRFSAVSPDLCNAIREKRDLIALESLLVTAVVCTSIEDFSKEL